MLGSCNATEVNDGLWEALASRAEPPGDISIFINRTGTSPAAYDCQRRYPRFFLRTKAILKRSREFHSVFVQDISRQGIGVVAPVQIFPRERLRLWLPDRPPLDLITVRCRRLGTLCYECGTQFALSQHSPSTGPGTDN